MLEAGERTRHFISHNQQIAGHRCLIPHTGETQMKAKQLMIAAVSTAFLAAMPAFAQSDTGAVVVPKGELKWKDMGNGVAIALVKGELEKGPSHFFMKYPTGLVTPKHYHSASHSSVVMSGTVTLNVNGKDNKLGPGSYADQPAKTWHVAKVEGNEDVIWFVQAEGPWDAVFEKSR
jgi:quercetin dioxygenase-like cupin family protein